MYPTLFELGGKPVNSWLVFALIGAWIAWYSLRADLVKRAALPPRQVALFFFGCVGAWFLAANAGQLLTVGHTGYVLYAGMFGVIAFGGAAWVALGWHRKLLVQELWDFGGLALCWAMIFGRIGCLLYGCCFGSPAGPWPGYLLNKERWDFALRRFPEHLDGVKLHAAIPYEIAGLIAVLFALRWARSKGDSIPPGVTGWICWLSYAVIRFLTEFLRGDERGAYVAGLSPSQWFAVATFAAGLFLVRWDWRKNRTRPRRVTATA